MIICSSIIEKHYIDLYKKVYIIGWSDESEQLYKDFQKTND